MNGLELVFSWFRTSAGGYGPSSESGGVRGGFAKHVQQYHTLEGVQGAPPKKGFLSVDMFF